MGNKLELFEQWTAEILHKLHEAYATESLSVAESITRDYALQRLIGNLEVIEKLIASYAPDTDWRKFITTVIEEKIQPHEAKTKLKEAVEFLEKYNPRHDHNQTFR